MKKVAVLLCGSGFKDGSEIHESVLTLLALSKRGVTVRCFAQDRDQHHVVNALTGAASSGEVRNQRVESARIARGEVDPLSSLQVLDFDALILPGGFGAAKNLCTYAFEGADGRVMPEVSRVLQAFFANRKPIGAICIAPMILALEFKGSGLHLTFGPKDEEVDANARALGQVPVECPVEEICVDEAHRVVTTPAYMYEKPAIHRVAEGIDRLVDAVLKMT